MVNTNKIIVSNIIDSKILYRIMKDIFDQTKSLEAVKEELKKYKGLIEEYKLTEYVNNEYKILKQWVEVQSRPVQ